MSATGRGDQQSDLPALSKNFWEKWTDMPREKRQITLRLDADILEYFRQFGRRYQTRINTVLRAFVNVQKERQ